MVKGVQTICALGLFLAGYIFYSSALLQVHYAAEFTLSSLQIGMVQAAVPCGAILGAIFAGCLGDAFGRQRLLKWSFLASSIIALTPFFVFDYISLYLFRFLSGVIAGMLYPLCAAYLTEMNAEYSLARQSAWLMFVNCLAAPFGCVVAMILETHFTGGLLWRLVAAFYIVPAATAFNAIKSLPESPKWLATKKTHKQSLSQLLQPNYRSMSLCLMGTWFLMDVAYYGINFFVPYLLRIMSITDGTFFIALFFSLSAGAAIFVVDKVNLHKLQKYGFFIASLSLGLMAFFNSQQSFVVILLFVLFNFALNIGPDVTTYLLSATSYPTHMRASSHGFIAGIAKVGSVLGVLLLPIVQNIWGVQTVILLLTLTLFLAYLLSVRLQKLSEEFKLRETGLAYETN